MTSQPPSPPSGPESSAQWWVERGGTTVGPYDLGALQALADTGSLTSQTRVCRNGQTFWQLAAHELASLRFPQPPYTAPAGQPQQSGYPNANFQNPTAQYGYPPPNAPPVMPPARQPTRPLEHSSPGTAALLTFITLGIFWFIWIYPRMLRLREKSGRTGTKPETLFWITIGIFVVSFFLLPFIGTMVSLITLGVLISEILKDRDVLNERLQLTGRVHSASSYISVYIVEFIAGILGTSLLLIGLIAVFVSSAVGGTLLILGLLLTLISLAAFPVITYWYAEDFNLLIENEPGI